MMKGLFVLIGILKGTCTFILLLTKIPSRKNVNNELEICITLTVSVPTKAQWLGVLK
jgi:hypothetical protein